MNHRVEAGTDVAMIGVWDEGAGKVPAQDISWETIEQDAEEGKVVVVRTGGDGGGPVDMYVGEEVPGERRGRMKVVGEGLLLSVTSGRVVVDGMEDYRSGREAVITDAASVVEVPVGKYAVRCFEWDVEGHESRREAAMRAAVGAADWEAYKENWIYSAGCLIPVVATVMIWGSLIWAGWQWGTGALWQWALIIVSGVIAAAVGAAGAAGLMSLNDRRLRNDRFQRVKHALDTFGRGEEAVYFTLELLAVSDSAGMRGGIVEAG